MINYKEELNPAQYEAATTVDGPVLIIAGAGSGKTRTLIYRVAYMIEQKNVAPEQILLMTFTNAAAKEMKDRAGRMLDERCDKITACTYHSFCATMLRKYGRNVIHPKFSIITSTEVPDIINFAKKKHPDTYKIKGFPPAKTLAGIFSAKINKGISMHDAIDEKNPDYLAFEYQIVQLFEDYNEFKKEKHYADYDDLLVLFSKILDNPNIRKAISNRYKYIMVDEYQDTNSLQEQIILKLRMDCNNIAVVGDDYQSIYAFRGSNINNILDFPKKFPGCKKIILNINYRSTQEILNLANTVMDKYAEFGFKKKMTAHGKTGRMPKIIIPDDGQSEARAALNMIKAFHAQGMPYNEMAVIERKSASSFLLENLLNKEGIPFEKRGGLKFLEYECVQDMLALLRCHVNYTDELAWFRILKVLAGIGDVYSARIAEMCGHPDFLIENGYRNRKFYPDLIEINDFMNSLKNLPEDDFYRLFNSIKKYYLKKKEQVIKGMDTTEDRRAEAMEKLKTESSIIDELWNLYGKGKKSPEAMLDALVLDESPDNDDEAEDKLVITTIHSAKGLEWDAVIMLDCIEGVFPGNETINNKKADMEELRCFYVAITRARKYLQIMAPECLFMYGKYISGTIAHYLELDNSEKLYTIAKMCG